AAGRAPAGAPDAGAPQGQASGGSVARAQGPTVNAPANELGQIMVLEYHRIGPHEGEWYRSEANFRKDLQSLYDKGYRPITMRDVLAGNINVPAGTTPVVFTFDDSSQGQFYYLPDGSIDPHTMVGMWTAFKQRHPDWSNGATWCVLPGAVHPSNFWGEKPDKQIPRAQREATIHKKVDFLVQNGHELCDHTMWHAKLSNYPDAFVQDQLGSWIDSTGVYLPRDYRVVTMALPLGLWPKNRPLAWHGTYRNGKTYHFQGVLEVSGGPNVSPFDARWNPHSIKRVIAAPNALERQLAYYDTHPGERYVSDGDPSTVTFPAAMASHLDRGKLGGRTAKPAP
ncbi:MAG: polysaccharide deacetylase, partial [Gemmatimonadetes bacterium]|nr:polysaccharide deacetylase [Gemmatimonadota bacterium]